VVVCHLTRWLCLSPPAETLIAEDLAHIFLSQVFVKHGTPDRHRLDQGITLHLAILASLCQLLSIKGQPFDSYPLRLTANRTGQPDLGADLRVYVNYQQDDWVNLLPCPSLRTTTTLHSATMVTHSLPTRAPSETRSDLELLCQILLTQVDMTFKELLVAF